MKRLLFISNLKSGKNQIKPHFSSIIDMFVAAGYEVTVHTTQAVRDAYESQLTGAVIMTWSYAAAAMAL